MPFSPFFPKANQLPATLPIFPLENAVVLPHAELPLNIFEKRYLNMVNDALATHHLIGMIQPSATGDKVEPNLFHTGCAGRITSFNETADGRILINLTGVCRFDVEQELASIRGYRVVKPSWRRFLSDLDVDIEINKEERDSVLRLMKRYFEAKNLTTDWQQVEKLTSLQLVNNMSINMPLDPLEKQAILEAETLKERSMALRSAMQFGIEESSGFRSH